MEKSINKMGTMPVNKLMLTLGAPMIISMVLQAVYNIVDSAFVSNMQDTGEMALNALTLAFPIQMLMVAVSIGTGVGTNALLSRCLGMGDSKKAARVGGNAMFLAIIIYVLCLIFGIFGVGVYIGTQTTNSQIYDMATDYLRICSVISMGIVFFSIFEKMLQATGLSLYSTVAQITGAVINIILDPIMIYGLFGFPQMGVKGAALATIISQGVSCLWVLKFLTGKKTVLKIRLKNLVLDGKIVTSVLSLGVSPFIMQATECLIQLTFNNGMLKYGNDLYVALMSILFSLTQLIWMPLNGFSQGAQPVIGYNYGAKRFDRVKKAFKLQFTVSICFSLFAVVLVEVFPTAFLKMFTNDQELIDIGINSTRLFLAGMSVMGAQCACQQTFLALGEAKISMFLACLRKIILLFPLALILPNIANMGVWGLLLAEPVSDVVAASCTTIMFTIRSRKILKQ